MPRRWKNAPKEPASIATAEIAYACRKTSSTLPGVEIGFGSWDETVRSCVLVQKRESPNVVISVPFACRSKTKTSTLAMASRATVATKRNVSLERRCLCVAEAPRATLSASRLLSRTGCAKKASIHDEAVAQPASSDQVIAFTERTTTTMASRPTTATPSSAPSPIMICPSLSPSPPTGRAYSDVRSAELLFCEAYERGAVSIATSCRRRRTCPWPRRPRCPPSS